MQIIASDVDGEWQALVNMLYQSRCELHHIAPLTVPVEGQPNDLGHALTILAGRLPELGILSPRRVVLMRSDLPSYDGEMIPDDGGTSFIPVVANAIVPSLVALVTTAAAMTRWRHGWNGWWKLLTDRPLRELVYVEGIGRHAAAALIPDLPDHHQFALTPVQLRRIQERERSLTPRLLRDLDASGIVGWLRWLAAGTGEAARRDEAGVIPPGAGRYLAWRFTARRVERLGVAGAITAAAEPISSE